MRRIAHRARQLLCLFRRLDHGNEQRGRAQAQHLLDQGGIAMRQAPHRMRGIGRDALQRRQQAAQVVRRMFRVEHQPVETAAGAQLGRIGIGQCQPQADLEFAARQPPA